MQRDILKAMQIWRDKKNRKPLILTGVRQCGKTYALRQFGETCFEDMAYFNFEKSAELSSIFEYNFDTDRIISELESLVLGHKITIGKTLVIFDEIQACPRAITSLKYFCENLRELHLAAAGSLLGVALKSEEISFPVGKVDQMVMYPMNFHEFVQADGGQKYLDGAKKYAIGKALPELYTAALEKYLKLYYIIGGMPEAVQEWIDSHNFENVETIQDNILMGYANDFSKHAPLSEVPKLSAIWDSVPEQLAKENNKFVFSHVKKGGRAKNLEDALQWLLDAGLVYKLELVEKPEIPLSYMADATYFKLYMADVGLLRRKSNVYYKTILEESEGYVRFKGAITENYVLNEVISQNIPAWFWRSGNTAEVDFLVEYHGDMFPIEVKSADNMQAKSFRQFCKKYSPKRGFKASLKSAGTHTEGTTEVYSLPLYLMCQFKERFLGG